MTELTERYPGIEDYLDDSDEYNNTATEFKQGDDRFLVVTQQGQFDGQQLLFKWSGQQFEFWDNETIVDSLAALGGAQLPGSPAATLDALAVCAPSPINDHLKVYQVVLSEVNRFDSSNGPDHGNLACVWTVRHIVKKALNRWITKTDGTATFGQELHACFGHGSNLNDLPEGAIVISPTQNIPGSKKRNIGHIGLLGKGNGDARLIYSNSSRDRRLEQNFDVSSWIARYETRKHLQVLYYPLPLKSIPGP
jgi:hypothetical protein